MNRRFDQELSGPLAASVRSADAVPDDAVRDAQARLLARVQAAPRRREHGPARAGARAWWMAAAATLAIAVLVVATAPMLPGNGDAFAAVQARFRHFDTLAMTIVQRFDGQPLQTSRTVVDARGVLRTDVGEELSIIVDPVRGRLLTLLHGSREAMLAPLPKAPARDTRGSSAPASPGDALSWLDALRTFKGKATPLAETRIIDGHRARGWRLSTQGITMELWADADGLPLAMRQLGGGGLEIDYRFEFDRPIPPGHLRSDPPAGYALVRPDED